MTLLTARPPASAARRGLLCRSDERSDIVNPTAMNDDEPVVMLAALRTEHRRLDEQIQLLSSEPTGDQLEIARLKRRKLQLKDQIQRIVDSNIPDIIA